MTNIRRAASTIVAAAVAALTMGVGTPVSAAEATIHPGVQTYTEGAQCTANFVFSDGTDVFIGQAAHCSGTGEATDTNGCTSDTLPNGTQVEIDGASRPGTMVYNSWIAMQTAKETNEDACWNNDFALVRIDPADHDKVSASIPTIGGPECINTTGTQFGDTVYSYGNSSLRLGITVLSPKEGYSLGTEANGWTHLVYTGSPGIPGDSGSAFVDANGCALGVLSTLAFAPFPGSNYVSDLNKALGYMRAHSSFDGVTLQLGGDFVGGRLL